MCNTHGNVEFHEEAAETPLSGASLGPFLSARR
jgi:hypothetical protein